MDIKEAVQKVFNDGKYISEYIYHIENYDDWQRVEIMRHDGTCFFDIYKYDDENTLYIENLHIYKEFQGKGIGNGVMDIFEKIGKNMKVKELKLFCYKDGWIQKWYERLGYSALIERDDYMIWMTKELK